MDKWGEIFVSAGAVFLWLFELPEGQGILYSFQPLIATLIALFAAIMAYYATTYAARKDAINRAKYYNSTIQMIAASLEDLNKRIKNIQDTNKFSDVSGLLSFFRSYDMECFDYNFVAHLTSKEIQHSVQIKISFSSIIELIEQYEVLFEELNHEIEQGHNSEVIQIENYLRMLLVRIQKSGKLVIQDVNTSLQMTNKKFK